MLGLGHPKVAPGRTLLWLLLAPIVFWKVTDVVSELADRMPERESYSWALLGWWWPWPLGLALQAAAFLPIRLRSGLEWHHVVSFGGGLALLTAAVLTFRVVWNLNSTYRAHAGLQRPWLI